MKKIYVIQSQLVVKLKYNLHVCVWTENLTYRTKLTNLNEIN